MMCFYKKSKIIKFFKNLNEIISLKKILIKFDYKV